MSSYIDTRIISSNEEVVCNDNIDTRIISSNEELCNNNNNINVLDVIVVIEQGLLSSIEIMKKYNISSYRFYKIVREYNVKTKKSTRQKVPKNTKFKQLLYGTEEQQKAAKILPEGFNLQDFITDSKNNMKITELIQKYNLTLYQIRELRKKYDLKKR
jgi:hypothetical protein